LINIFDHIVAWFFTQRLFVLHGFEPARGIGVIAASALSGRALP
jgi:hypothetical protein